LSKDFACLIAATKSLVKHNTANWRLLRHKASGKMDQPEATERAALAALSLSPHNKYQSAPEKIGMMFKIYYILPAKSVLRKDHTK